MFSLPQSPLHQRKMNSMNVPVRTSKMIPFVWYVEQDDLTLHCLNYSQLSLSYNPHDASITQFVQSAVIRKASNGRLACLFSSPGIVYGAHMALMYILHRMRLPIPHLHAEVNPYLWIRMG